jgi:predicted RNA binding protein YcfA (HicA-like mRNA interferase family)
MAGLPVVGPRQVVAALQRAGFSVHHQTGSHLVLRSPGPPPRRTVVPMHGRDLKRGTLRAIIREAGLTIEEFVALL